MRARNIKPGFWRNEQLVEQPFQTRLLFIGLWNLADREGRVENRPKKIKLEIFPADDVDISLEITRLSEAGLVKVYEVEGVKCIQVVNFKKHQNPHHREAASELPEPPSNNLKVPQPPENKEASESPGQAPDKPEESRADSGFLNPDSGYRIPENYTPSASGDAHSSQKKSTPSTKKSAEVDYSSWPELPGDQILKDWLKARAKARAVHSQTAINSIGKELHKAVAMGYTVNQCGEEAATRGWRGFKAEWLQGSVQPANRAQHPQADNVRPFRGRKSVEEHNQEVALRWAAGGDFYEQE